jgi:hypothetical protein
MHVILEYFFQIHDPTTRNRQGNDIGTSYRSAIFYTSDAQRKVAEETIADVNASGLWPGKVVTEVKFLRWRKPDSNHRSLSYEVRRLVAGEWDSNPRSAWCRAVGWTPGRDDRFCVTRRWREQDSNPQSPR